MNPGKKLGECYCLFHISAVRIAKVIIAKVEWRFKSVDELAMKRTMSLTRYRALF
jgi:hypothetical protein